MFIKIEGPEQLVFPDQSRVNNKEEYLGWHAYQVAQRGVAIVSVCHSEVNAYINHGRWIANCQNCEGTGMRTAPTWGIACCISCGTVFPNIKFPADTEVIEKLLLARPKRDTQSWLPYERAEDLFRENVEHGVAV